MHSRIKTIQKLVLSVLPLVRVPTEVVMCRVNEFAPILPLHLRSAVRTGASAFPVPGEMLRYSAEAICLYLQRKAPRSHAPF